MEALFVVLGKGGGFCMGGGGGGGGVSERGGAVYDWCEGVVQ